MNIQGYQKLTLLDFPGRVACTVFTGGCNLRCPFCHNAGLVRTPFSLANSEEELLATGLVDYVAMDVKSSPQGYAAATGREGDVTPFLQSIRLLKESGIPHEFRTTVVKGIHTAADIDEIGKLLAGSTRYFLQPFRDSGNLLGHGCSAFSEAEMSAFLDIAKKYIPAAELRGQG